MRIIYLAAFFSLLGMMAAPPSAIAQSGWSSNGWTVNCAQLDITVFPESIFESVPSSDGGGPCTYQKGFNFDDEDLMDPITIDLPARSEEISRVLTRASVMFDGQGFAAPDVKTSPDNGAYLVRLFPWGGNLCFDADYNCGETRAAYSKPARLMLVSLPEVDSEENIPFGGGDYMMWHELSVTSPGQPAEILPPGDAVPTGISEWSNYIINMFPHELFHAVQAAYIPNLNEWHSKKKWFSEGTAVTAHRWYLRQSAGEDTFQVLGSGGRFSKPIDIEVSAESGVTQLEVYETSFFFDHLLYEYGGDALGYFVPLFNEWEPRKEIRSMHSFLQPVGGLPDAYSGFVKDMQTGRLQALRTQLLKCNEDEILIRAPVEPARKKETILPLEGKLGYFQTACMNVDTDIPIGERGYFVSFQLDDPASELLHLVVEGKIVDHGKWFGLHRRLPGDLYKVDVAGYNKDDVTDKDTAAGKVKAAIFRAECNYDLILETSTEEYKNAALSMDRFIDRMEAQSRGLLHVPYRNAMILGGPSFSMDAASRDQDRFDVAVGAGYSSVDGYGEGSVCADTNRPGAPSTWLHLYSPNRESFLQGGLFVSSLMVDPMVRHDSVGDWPTNTQVDITFELPMLAVQLEEGETYTVSQVRRPSPSDIPSAFPRMYPFAKLLTRPVVPGGAVAMESISWANAVRYEGRWEPCVWQDSGQPVDWFAGSYSMVNADNAEGQLEIIHQTEIYNEEEAEASGYPIGTRVTYARLEVVDAAAQHGSVSLRCPSRGNSGNVVDRRGLFNMVAEFSIITPPQ